MEASREAPELDLLAVHYVPRVRVLPLLGHHRLPVRVNEEVEGARLAQEGEEGHLLSPPGVVG